MKIEIKTKTKLLEKLRKWTKEPDDDRADTEIDSSRFMQKIGSTMMLNGLVLMIIAIKIPWFYFDRFYVSLYDGLILFPFLFSGPAIFFIFTGSALFYFTLRSLISKRFEWHMSLMFSGSYFPLFILNYFLLKHAISEGIKVTTVTGPGLWISLIASLLITGGSLLVYLTRKKDDEIHYRVSHKWGKHSRRKRRPVRR